MPCWARRLPELDSWILPLRERAGKVACYTRRPHAIRFELCCNAHSVSEMGQKHRISVLLSPAFMSEMAPIPTNFVHRSEKH
jgi:hypothetical protein